MRIKFKGRGLKITINGIDVNVFDDNGNIPIPVRQELTRIHIEDPTFTLFKVNKYAKALKNDYNNEYYFDANHRVVWGKDIPVAYAHDYVMRVYIEFKNGTILFIHAFNSPKKYNNLEDPELIDEAFRDLTAHLGKNSKDAEVKLKDIRYKGVVPINRWRKSLSVNGSLLHPNISFIDTDGKYVIKEDRCFYDLILIECGNKKKAMGEELYNKLWLVDKSYARPRKTPHPRRYENLWEDLWGIPFKDAKKDRPTNKDLWAVNVSQIKDFAIKYEMSIYICNVSSNLIFHNVGKKYPITLFAVLDNGHLTIIPKRQTKKRKSLSAKALENNNTFGEEGDIIKKEVNNKIVWCKDHTEVFSYLKDIVENDKTYPIKNIKCNSYNGLFNFSGFTMDNGEHYTHYVIQNKMNLTDYKFYGKDYYGQSLIGEVCGLYEDKEENKMPLSHMSPYLFDLFTKKTQKDKAPRGWRNEEVFYGIVNNVLIDDDSHFIPDEFDGYSECDKTITIKREGWKTFDICKCYWYVIKNMTYYYELGFNSVPHKYKGGEIRKGFYYVNTDYNLLFTGSKWYSDEIVLKGLTEGIIDCGNIEYYIRPKKIHKGDYFNILIEQLKDKYKGDIDTAKRAICSLAGLAQRHKKIKQRTHKFTDKAKDVSDYLNANREYGRYDLVLDGLYLYGSREDYNMYSNHLPIGNQLLDKASILLYDKVRQLTNIEYPKVYLFTDSITIHKDELKKGYKRHIKTNNTKKIGDLVEEYKDYLLEPNLNNDIIYRPFINDEDFEEGGIRRGSIDFGVNNSDDWEKYCKLIDTNKSIMTEGDAGCGKSEIIKNLSPLYKLMNVSFTNKACNKLPKGMTYHNATKIGIDKAITKEMIDKLKKKNYDAIVAEEFSMNNGWIWRLLCVLKRELNIPILAFGDWKQIPPVKDDTDYKNHLLVNNIFDYTTTLTKNWRADKKLVGLFNTYATNMIEFPLEELPLKKALRFKNICYTNNKRKFINSCCAKVFNKDKKAFITYSTTEKDEKDNTYDDTIYCENNNPTQNISVSVGMPMICRKTKKNKADEYNPYYYNNEEFIITKIGQEVISLEQQINTKYSADELMKVLKIKRKLGKDELIKEYIDKKKPTQDMTMNYMVELKSVERKDKDIIVNIPLDDLQRVFLVAFCITTHKAQGDTIVEVYNIYEWEKMDNALKYTALSRTKSHKKVCVM